MSCIISIIALMCFSNFHFNLALPKQIIGWLFVRHPIPVGNKTRQYGVAFPNYNFFPSVAAAAVAAPVVAAEN